MGIAALAISKGCGKGGREDGFIVLSSTLSIRPAFPSLFFCKSLKIDPNSLSQILNTGTEPDRVRLAQESILQQSSGAVR